MFGNQFSDSTARTEIYRYPAFAVYFICANSAPMLLVKPKPLSAEDMKPFVKDLLGAMQVVDFFPESPSKDVFQIGDMIIKIGSSRITNQVQMFRALEEVGIRKTVPVTIVREGKETIVNAQVVEGTPNLEPLSLKVLTDRKSHEWWNKQVRTDRDNWKSFQHTDEYHFKDVNYLKQDKEGLKQYARLKNLADNNKIQAKTLDLSDQRGVARVIQAMKDHEPSLHLSVLDVSNAWEKGYISKDDKLTATKTLIEQFHDVAYPQSRFLATRRIDMKVGERLKGEFGYIGASYDKLAKASADLTNFMKLLQEIQARDNPKARAIDAFTDFNPHVVTTSPQIPQTEDVHQ
jgi:hypothetical protein